MARSDAELGFLPIIVRLIVSSRCVISPFTKRGRAAACLYGGPPHPPDWRGRADETKTFGEISPSDMITHGLGYTIILKDLPILCT
ncbi:hypothetical protein CHELA20_50912 [Hyphomicrobiales bacterium]|nr:hypothetical protein CHELA20_50912 [Hyphomicrobiales bacterium]CAH1675401.1 hypothetical protein CHELA41_24102 [Hyphomicrobiales bacterium]